MMEEENKSEYKRVFTIQGTTSEREEEIEVDEEDFFEAAWKLGYILSEGRYIPYEVIEANREPK